MSDEKKRFIITFKDHVTDPAIAKCKEGVTAAGGEITAEYTLIKGFAANLPAFHAESLEKDENVNSIEEDKEVKIQ